MKETNCLSTRLTSKEIVSPRYWEMRKLIVSYRDSCDNGCNLVKRGDLVSITRQLIPPEPNIWIVIKIDDGKGITLGNGRGEVLYCPAQLISVCVLVLSSISDVKDNTDTTVHVCDQII